MIRIGTRGSLLALCQAREVAAKLRERHGLGPDALSIVEIQTEGDRILDRPLAQVGGKGLFTKEIERALLDGRIDIAVHSMKDVETALPDGTEMAAILEREDVRDVFISGTYASLADMPAGARLGTSSLRRRAQAKYANPGIELVDFRGNVQTRMDKLSRNVADATFLARAGLNRLGVDTVGYATVDAGEMLPAVAQGAIGLQVRADDQATRNLVMPLDHAATSLCVTAERAYLASLMGLAERRLPALGNLSMASSASGRQSTHRTDRNATRAAGRVSPLRLQIWRFPLPKNCLQRPGRTFSARTLETRARDGRQCTSG